MNRNDIDKKTTIELVSDCVREHDSIMLTITSVRKKMEGYGIALGMNTEYAKNHIASSAFLRGWLIGQKTN